MNHSFQHEPIELFSARNTRPERSDSNSHSSGGRHTDADPKTVFILDARGRIQFCSDSAIFAGNENSLLGHPITSLVPGLPLREATPGYNIAYVRFSYEGGQWHRYAVRTAAGSLQEAHVSLKPIPLERGYCLLSVIRFSDPRRAATQFACPARSHPRLELAREGRASCLG